MTKNNHGFTLIELIVTIAVFGILVAVAAPSFTAYTDSSRRVSVVNNFSGSLSYARSTAINQGRTISMCARTSGAETCSGGNDWKNGWLIFDDTNGNGALNAGENLIRVFKPLSSNTTITAIAGIATAVITFRESGFITSTGSTTYRYCGGGGTNDARAIIVSKTGRSRLITTTCP